MGSRVVDRRVERRWRAAPPGIVCRPVARDHHVLRPTPDRAVRESTGIAEVARRLASRFPQLSTGAVQTAVDQAHREFAGARTRDFVPLFVEYIARDTLARATAGTA